MNEVKRIKSRSRVSKYVHISTHTHPESTKPKMHLVHLKISLEALKRKMVSLSLFLRRVTDPPSSTFI